MAIVHKVSDLTLHYTLSKVVVHLQVAEIFNVLHSLPLGVAQLFGFYYIVYGIVYMAYFKPPLEYSCSVRDPCTS